MSGPARPTANSVLSPAAIWLYIVVIAATWGTAFGFMRFVVVEGTPPLVVAALRGLMTGGVLALWLVATQGRVRLDRINLRHAAVLGVTNGLLPNVLNAVALGEIASAPAAMILASTPLFVAMAAHAVVGGERLTGRSLAGLGLGFAGVFLLVGPEEVLAGRASLLAAVALLGAAMSYAATTVYLRRTRPADPLALSFGQQMFAGVSATALALVTEPIPVWALPGSSWIALIGLAAVATALPRVLYFRLASFAPVGKAASVSYVIPLAATLYGVLLLGETLPPGALVGGAVVLLGVWVVNTAAVAKQPQTS